MASVPARSGLRPFRGLRARVLGGMAAILLSPCPANATGTSADAPVRPGIDIAIAPFLPARTLVRNYQPMRAHLERTLRQPVTVVTAPDYLTYFERLARGEYQVIVTAAHSAWLAHAESGYVPMLRPVIPTSPVLVVRKVHALRGVRELRGQTIALPDPMAIIAMQGMTMLRDAGLGPDKDVRLKYLPNHSAAVNHVLAGEAAAAIVSDRALRQMALDVQNKVRIVRTDEKAGLPGVVYLASPDLSNAQVTALTGAILEFARNTPEGRGWMNDMGYGGLLPATVADLAPIAPYGAMLKDAITRARDKNTVP